MSSQHRFTVIDALTGEKQTVNIKADRNGFTIELFDDEPSIVLDLAGGRLRVFITNENGDCPNDALGFIGKS